MCAANSSTQQTNRQQTGGRDTRYVEALSVVQRAALYTDLVIACATAYLSPNCDPRDRTLGGSAEPTRYGAGRQCHSVRNFPTSLRHSFPGKMGLLVHGRSCGMVLVLLPVSFFDRCIKICSELYYPAPDRKTSCGAAAWNGPSKQCYLKTHKSKPMAKKGDISFVLKAPAE